MSHQAICIPNVRGGRTGDDVRSTTLQNDAHSKVIQFQFAPGRGLSQHKAPFAITIYLASGEATIAIGAETHDATQCFWAYLPPNLEHAITAKTEVTLLVTMVKDATATNP